MNTGKKALSVTFAATLAGGAGLGTASVATASPAPAVNAPAQVAMQQMAQVTITIDNFEYSVSGPVAPGAPITVVNNDDVPHTVTDPNGAFDTGTIDPGATATFTAPEQPGEYSIICTIHPNMSGSLVVQAASGGTTDDGGTGGASMDSGGSTSGGEAMDDSAMNDDGAGMEQQVSPMPEGGADTGVTDDGAATNLGVLALGGGLVLAAAVGGTYVVRRRSTNHS